MSLQEYRRKRRFGETPEPDDERRGAPARRPIFVVQLHHASSRHYDFRLEADGVLKSWAVPKGPSLRVGEKRLAVEVEDHPLSYATFAGDIPEGHYGAGHVDVYDHGTWSCNGDPLEAIAAGKVDFVLHGSRLKGGWKLVRTAMKGKQHQWLLIKRDDDQARDADADALLGVPAVPAKRAAATRAAAAPAASAKKVTRTATSVKTTRTRRSTTTTKRTTTIPSARRNADARWNKRALSLEHAASKPYPHDFKPQLTDHRASAPDGEAWLHEIKWDGYRLLADVNNGEVALRSRNGLNWTDDFPEVVQAIAALPVTDLRLDGELVVLDAQGRSDFTALQKVIDGTAKQPLRYVVFDMPGVAGVDISRAPLLDRKALLKELLGDMPGTLAYSDHVLDHGPAVFDASGSAGFEGIISKRVDAPYVNARSPSWVKVKHENTDEFLVVGYTDPKGSRSGFGSLLMATPDKRGLRYVGRVGTGFDDARLAAMHRQLKALETDTAAVELPSHVPFKARSVHWVEPILVAEVAFRGWAKEGLLRQASFKRLREDKQAGDLGVVSETASGTPGSKPKAVAGKRQTSRDKTSTASTTAAQTTSNVKVKRSAETVSEVTISHPERVVFAKAGLTKGDVADYYRQMARWILPEVARRPLSLLRCPDGVDKPCFFQKHHGTGLGDAVQAIPLQQKSGREDYLYIQDVEGLLQLVQMNTLELHPWGASVEDPEHPDRLVFDLDPGDGVTWTAIKAAARDVRDRLQEIGLESFVRLSGGKGVHVVVPLKPKADWAQAKDFCESFAQALAEHAPDRYVATMSKAKRNGVIFIDWLRNARGATSVCSWSLRARPSAGVAVPLRWEELARISGSDAFPLPKALQRARTLKQDPWEGIDQVKQVLPNL